MMHTSYVYLHLDGEEVVYVGSGTGGRAWSCKGTDRRNTEHKLWIENKILDDRSFVKFKASRITKEEASILERSLIEKLQPKYNHEFTEAWLKEKSEQGHKMAQSHNRKTMTPYGVFESITKAAKAHGVHPNTIAYRCGSSNAEYCYLEKSKHWRTTQ